MCSFSLLHICGGLGLFQELSFKSMTLSHSHSGDIHLYSSSGSKHLFVLCGVASNKWNLMAWVIAMQLLVEILSNSMTLSLKSMSVTTEDTGASHAWSMRQGIT